VKSLFHEFRPHSSSERVKCTSGFYSSSLPLRPKMLTIRCGVEKYMYANLRNCSSLAAGDDRCRERQPLIIAFHPTTLPTDTFHHQVTFACSPSNKISNALNDASCLHRSKQLSVMCFAPVSMLATLLTYFNTNRPSVLKQLT
jgi:hypothetical protein